jgi:hypothetical protein
VSSIQNILNIVWKCCIMMNQVLLVDTKINQFIKNGPRMR